MDFVRDVMMSGHSSASVYVYVCVYDIRKRFFIHPCSCSCSCSCPCPCPCPCFLVVTRSTILPHGHFRLCDFGDEIAGNENIHLQFEEKGARGRRTKGKWRGEERAGQSLLMYLEYDVLLHDLIAISLHGTKGD